MSELETAGVVAVPASQVTPLRGSFPNIETPKEKPLPFTDLFSISRDLDSTVAAVADITNREDERYDPSFSVDEQMLQDSGIPADYWGELADSPSEQVFNVRALRLHEDIQNEGRLADAGWAGVAARLSANFLDEGAWALTAASEGTLAPLIFAHKMTRMARAVRSGALVGAESAALEAVVANASETRDARDVLYAGLTGMAMGGTLGGLLANHRPNEWDAKLVEKVENTKQLIDEFQVREAQQALGLQNPPSTKELVPNQSLSAAAVGRDIEGPTQFSTTLFNPTATPVTPGPAEQSSGWQRTINFMRFDVVGKLLTSTTDYTRYAADRLAENAIGFYDRASGRGGTASEWRERFIRTKEAALFREKEPAFKDWLKGNGRSSFQKWSTTARSEFESLVSGHLRGSRISDDPHVKRAAAAYAKAFKEQLDELSSRQVKGFDQIAENPNYVPRLFNYQAIAEHNERFGEKAMIQFIGDSIRVNKPDLDPELVSKIARAYWRKLNRMRVGDEMDTSNLLSQDNHEIILGVLKDDGVDDDSIEAVRKVLTQMRAMSGKDDGGRTPRAKRRLDLSEGHRAKLRGFDGKDHDVYMDDLFEQNTEVLYRHYMNVTAGHAAIAEAFKDLRFENSLTGETVEGIKSRGDWDAFVREIRYKQQFDSKANEKLAVRNATRGDEEVENLQFLYDTITGRPPEDLSAAHVNLLGLVRSWNFARLMGQVGFAQLAEIGNIVAFGTMKNVIRFVPELVNIAKGADPALLKELEAATGLGTEMTRHVLNSRLEIEPGVPMAPGRGIMDKAHNVMDKARYGVSLVSGMTPITAAMQKTSMMVVAQRIYDMAAKGAAGFRGKEVLDASGKLVGYSRLLDLGIDEPMWQRISEQIKTHGKTVRTSDGKLQEFGLDKWDDLDAKSSLEMGIFRLSRRIVQENDVGVTRRWMHNSTAKTLLQFRSFAAQAHHKQLLWNMKHSDMTTFLAFSYSMMFGAAAFLAQYKLNNPDKPLPTDEEIAKAAFQRAGWSSLLPLAMDTVYSDVLGNDPLFSKQRASGLASGFVHGSPPIDLAEKVWRTAKLPAKVPQDDYTFSADDWKAMMGLAPFGNIIGVRNFNSLISSELPSHSEY
jgi:hypothetical protein